MKVLRLILKIVPKFNLFYIFSLIMTVAILGNFDLNYAQDVPENSVAGNQSVTHDKSAQTLIKFGVIKESQIVIHIYDADKNLAKIVKYDQLQPGIYEYDLYDQIPKGKYTCRLYNGESIDSFEIDLK